jgi:CTP:phosphocholine cytidylyltransferase-like protein
MNIVIPMAGLGSRFPNNPLPKPLIDINGMPMIQVAMDSLGIVGKFIFIVRSIHVEEFKIDLILKNLYDCEVIVVNDLTEGPACTAMLAKDFINNQDPLFIANCDQIMKWDSLSFNSFCKNYPHDGFVVTYFANTTKNSYASLDNNGLVKLIKEKEVISNVSLNGIHFWKKGSDFVDSFYKMVENDDRAPNGEFYIGPSYNHMISINKKIGIYHIPNEQHWAVGTEEDLNLYMRLHNDC